MTLNQSYELYDLLYDRFGSKKDIYKMSRYEIVYLKNLSIKRDDKSLRRVAEIKLRIVNDLKKNNILKEWCKTIDTKGYELLWCADINGVKRNQLYKILEGDYYCCKSCDGPMTFVSRQVPVKYCYFYKNKN